MINWIIIGVLIAIGFIFLKFDHHAKLIKTAVMVVLLLLLYFSLSATLKSTETDLSTPTGVIKTIYAYFGWIGQTGAELFDIGKDTVSLVGNVIKINQTEIKEKELPDLPFNKIPFKK